MHLSLLIFMLFFAGSGLIAPVGQQAMVEGTSHIFLRFSCSILAPLLCIATTAISEQWTAPHIFVQHATASLTLPGVVFSLKYSCRSSMMTFTRPDASVHALWQCIHP